MIVISSHRLRMIAGLVAIASVAFIAAGGALAAEESLSARLNATIDQEVERLKLPPRSTDLTSDKSVRAREAIERGDYATAQKIVEDVLVDRL
ncbi:MAG: hypothetical protein JO258_09225 [Alphaproteobacteria bacterium]|nr:hypothetical protein [Alphaproteobacteria bacterium]